MEVTVRIYQLDMVRAKKLVFNNKMLDVLGFVEPEKYNFVYEDIIRIKADNDVCVIFGESEADPRRGLFRGWPLRTNDLIEIICGTRYTLYQYDRGVNDFTDGEVRVLDQVDKIEPDFRNRKYNLSKATDLRDRLFGVLVNPKEPAEYADIELSDTVIRATFGYGYKALSLPTGECLLCCEGVFDRPIDEKAPGLNRMLLDDNGNGYGIVSGPIFFCKMNQRGILCSLTPNECAKLYNRYYLPENFYVYRRELRSVKNYPTPIFRKGAGK